VDSDLLTPEPHWSVTRNDNYFLRPVTSAPRHLESFLPCTRMDAALIFPMPRQIRRGQPEQD